MDKHSAILAALAPANGSSHTPVQIQKLLFLMDKQIPGFIGGPLFDFQPYDYGPFDKDVYGVLDDLKNQGLLTVDESGASVRRYSLTGSGQLLAQEVLDSLPLTARTYVQQLSAWVRSLSFQELVSAVYKSFPEMKVNSVFRG